MPMDNCPSSIWVDQLVVIGAAHVDESGLLQSFYEFPCCHELFIYIMRIKSNKNIRIMRIFFYGLSHPGGTFPATQPRTGGRPTAPGTALPAERACPG